MFGHFTTLCMKEFKCSPISSYHANSFYKNVPFYFNALLYFEVAAATCKRSHPEVFCKKAVVYKMRLQAQNLSKTNFLKLVKMLNLK